MQEKNIVSSIGKTNRLDSRPSSEIKNITPQTASTSATANASKTLSEPQSIISRAAFPEMSIVDESAGLLFSVMKGISSRDEGAVKSICACANEIHKLARLKLDYIKVKKEYPE